MMTTKMVSKKALLGLGVTLLVCVTAAFAAVNVKGNIIDALTGYTVAGAAANNRVICGNGTVGTYQATCGIAVASATTAGSATSATTAATATALATTPAQCSGGTPLATGIAANGDANCTAVTSSVKAWVTFNGVGGTTISASQNVASVSRSAAGKYVITFVTPMSSSNYAVSVSGTSVSGGTLVGGFIYDAAAGGSNPTTTTVTVAGIYQSGASLLTGDLERCDVVIVGN